MSLGVNPAASGAESALSEAVSSDQALAGQKMSKGSFQKILDQAEQASAESNQNVSRSFIGDIGSQSGAQTRDKKLKEAAEKMEGVFLNMMMKTMRKTVPDYGITKNSRGKDMFQARLDRKYANKMAETKNFGLAEAIYEQFSGESSQDGGKPNAFSAGSKPLSLDQSGADPIPLNQ